MRIGFLIGELATLQPTFAGNYLAWSAHRRGHEVCFVTADDLSFLDDGSVFATTLRVRAGDYAKPIDFYRALISTDAVREDDTLSGFDVVFIRYNPVRHGGLPIAQGSPRSSGPHVGGTTRRTTARWPSITQRRGVAARGRTGRPGARWVAGSDGVGARRRAH